ncbi:sigma factor [Catenibacillus scindens]|uniref:sigma factor n=1 Tax=Catenibacillus scindens TaxID=673271 RepID=UPI001621A7DE|nr:sigma factor [Catenibacillus scindens]
MKDSCEVLLLQSFPKPLTSEEERCYLERYRNGDEDAKNILIEKNLRLVAHIVKKYNNSGRDMDELIAIGIVGLVKAVNTFDADKGNRIVTYAARCIEKPILSLMRFYVLKRFPFTDQSRTGGYLPNILMKST